MGKKKIQKENQDSILRLKNSYRKRCDMNNVQPSKTFKDKLEVADQKGHMRQLQLTQPTGPVGIRSILQSYIQVEYTGLKVLRLLKVGAEDQGVRMICNYQNKYHSLEELDLTDNGITQLGCEFLSNSLADPETCLAKLKLTGNPIKTEGLQLLSVGLKVNNTLQKLSLKNCGIDSQGGRIIQIILANINSKIINLKLSNNPLQAKGLIQILKVFRANDCISKLVLRDIGFQLLKSDLNQQQSLALQLLKQTIKVNTNIKHYDIRFNPFPNTIAKELVDAVESNPIIQECRISETMDVELKNKLKDILDGRKVSTKKNKKN